MLLEASNAKENSQELVCEGFQEDGNKTGDCVLSNSEGNNCILETSDQSIGENDAHLKEILDQDFAMTLGIDEEELQLMEAMGKIQGKKDDQSIEVSFKH